MSPPTTVQPEGLEDEVGDPRQLESAKTGIVSEVHVRDVRNGTYLELDIDGIRYRVAPFVELDAGDVRRIGLTVSRKWPVYEC